MFDVTVFWCGNITVENGDDNDAQEEKRHDVDGSHVAKLDQQVVVGGDKGKKTNGRGQVGHQGCHSNFGRNPLQGLTLFRWTLYS